MCALTCPAASPASRLRYLPPAVRRTYFSCQRRRQNHAVVTHATSEESSQTQTDLEEKLKADMDRLQLQTDRLGARRAQFLDEPVRTDKQSPIREAIDKILMADFFFVLFVGAWLVAGVTETLGFKSSVLLDAWYPLWPGLFQPAIGLLMAGALGSGLAGYIADMGKPGGR